MLYKTCRLISGVPARSFVPAPKGFGVAKSSRRPLPQRHRFAFRRQVDQHAGIDIVHTWIQQNCLPPGGRKRFDCQKIIGLTERKCLSGKKVRRSSSSRSRSGVGRGIFLRKFGSPTAPFGARIKAIFPQPPNSESDLRGIPPGYRHLC